MMRSVSKRLLFFEIFNFLQIQRYFHHSCGSQNQRLIDWETDANAKSSVIGGLEFQSVPVSRIWKKNRDKVSGVTEREEMCHLENREPLHRQTEQ